MPCTLLFLSYKVPSYLFPHSLDLLARSRQLEGYRFTPQPQRDKRHPSSDRNANTRNPWPSAANDPTPRPFVMRKVSDRDSVLLFDIGEEWSLVIDLEVENSVLIREPETSCVDRGAWGRGQEFEGKTVEG